MKKILLLTIGLLLVFVGVAYAQVDWDKSTLSVVGQCLPGGFLRVTVTNSGADMQGPSNWELRVADQVFTSGTLQLAAGESTIIDFTTAFPKQRIEFIVYQRPGHPGLGYAAARLACSPTAVKLNALHAQVSWLDWFKQLVGIR